MDEYSTCDGITINRDDKRSLADLFSHLVTEVEYIVEGLGSVVKFSAFPPKLGEVKPHSSSDYLAVIMLSW